MWQALVFGAFSITVMTFWHFIAEKHRAFQQRSLHVAESIEEYVLGEKTFEAMRAASRPAREPRPSVRTARIGLLSSTVALWLLIAVLARQGLLP